VVCLPRAERSGVGYWRESSRLRSLDILYDWAFAFLLSCAGSGGGSTEDAPNAVRSGEPITITLNATSWGGPVRKRYSDVVLEYKLNERSELKRVEATLVSVTRPRPTEPKYEVGKYVFTIPPQPVTGQLMYHITLKFDGILNRRPDRSIVIQ
jgi:hypothetical protein